MKLIIFSVLISIIIPFSIQQETHQIFYTTTTPLSKRTQVVVDSTDENVIPLENMYRLDSLMSFSESSLSTTLQIVQYRLHIDAKRTDFLSAKAAAGISGTVYSGFSQGSGEFLMRVGFGTPPKLMQVVLDTGSDTIWIQCQPCAQCYEQPDHIFDPTKSNSSSKVLCGSKKCPTPNTTCSTYPNKRCPYEISYGDGSQTQGDYMTETLTFRGTKVNKILFGCGHNNTGLLTGFDGLLGLGWGDESFIGQVGASFSQVFSYCLVSLFSTGTSYILFGPAALSRKAVYTDMIRNRYRPDLVPFYYVHMKGISVGAKRVAIRKGVLDQDDAGRGGVIFDSGTAVTRLAQGAYEALRDAFQKRTTNLKRAPNISLFDTCYYLSGLKSVPLPTVVLHFKGRAKMILPANNIMVPMDDNGTTYCFAFAGTTGGLSIIGNIQQQGFRLSFDLKGKRLGFTPGSC